MIVWRVTRKAHAEQPLSGNAANQPLSGEGAKRYGGRWNHIGVAVVYTSQSLSLAVLEYLVNLPITDLPDDLVSVQIEISTTSHAPKSPSRNCPITGVRFHLSRN